MVESTDNMISLDEEAKGGAEEMEADALSTARAEALSTARASDVPAWKIDTTAIPKESRQVEEN